VPFADENQVRRLLLGDASAPPTPSSLASELDAALVRSGLDLLVVGPISAFTYPEGWRPDGRWCPVAHPGAVVVYATGAALAQTPSAAC
jgi:hypothetical protein